MIALSTVIGLSESLLALQIDECPDLLTVELLQQLTEKADGAGKRMMWTEIKYSAPHRRLTF